MDAAGVKLDSHNLRDLLRIRDEDFQNNLNRSTSSSSGTGSRSSRHHGLTLLAVLTDKGGPSPTTEGRSTVESTRTLLDVIRDDQIGGGRRDCRRTWRQLRDKIRLRHRDRMVIMTRRPGGSARFSSITHAGESSNSAISNARVPNLRANSGGETGRTVPPLEPASQLPRRSSIAEVIDHRAAEQPARMSLMALLEENDLQLGWEDSTRTIMFDDGVEIDEEPENVIGGASAGYNNCCVCMVRHKGAAFIPCGHTFCRLCSRELWVQRGNCPLCNNYILEILDIF